MSWCHRVPVSYPPPRDHKDYLVSKTLELTDADTDFLSLSQRDRTEYLLEKKAIAEELGDMCEAESGGSDACIFKKT
ncbi:hypothetical protein NEUTE2DRAFT_133426 [Neurospora tetrasperma FGSC 2509]|nr:hypothetical protein NEUTE2DRAFT_133426 [Neurospora tetrasperma FGSC 2509]